MNNTSFEISLDANQTEFPRGKRAELNVYDDYAGYDYYITDDLGGVHTDGVGYAPDGHFCGECTKETCSGCGAFAEAFKNVDVSMYNHWVLCRECIYFEECEIKEDRDGCLTGETEGE